jgi:hypothetical protein
MLKIPEEYDRDTMSAKFMDISRQIPAPLLGVSAANRELWRMSKKWLELSWGLTIDKKMAAVQGTLCRYNPVTVSSRLCKALDCYW